MELLQAIQQLHKTSNISRICHQNIQSTSFESEQTTGCQSKDVIHRQGTNKHQLFNP